MKSICAYLQNVNVLARKMSLVLIDDTSPSIQYSGPWFEVDNTQIDTGDFGPPFLNTLHGVNVTANFTFPFIGTELLVYGTSITTNVSGTQDPTWECFIDNNSIGWSNAPTTNSNNWILCGTFQLLEGPHVLTVQANVSNQQTFWFDQIVCSSASNETYLRIDSTNKEIQYSSGWQSLVQLINTSYTQITGATLTYLFTGTSISWVGYTQPLSVGTLTTSTYSIDGQTPISFHVPASPDSNTHFNQILFNTGQLSPGQHKLVVTYTGTTTTAPLVLNYFVLENTAFSTSSTSSRNAPTSTSVPSGSSSTSSPTSNVGSSSSSTTIDSMPTGAIVGGVIGGVVLISLLLALFFFIRRRNNRKVQALSEKSYIGASLEVVDPFLSAPSNHSTSTFLPQNYTSNGQSLPSSPPISSKVTQRDLPPSAPASSSSSGGISTLTPPRLQLSSPAPISPSSRLHLVGSQTNLIDGTTAKAREAAAEPLVQRSPSPQLGGSNSRTLRHEDSGVRMPPPEEDVVELPPFYTPG